MATHTGSPGHQVKLPGPPPGASVADEKGASTRKLVVIWTSEIPASGIAAIASSTKRCFRIRSVAGALPLAVTTPPPGIAPFGKAKAPVRLPIEMWTLGLGVTLMLGFPRIPPAVGAN